MYLKSLELTGFKSFARKSELRFTSPISAIVGPNGSGKSNTAEAFRFVLGEQSMKSMRGKRGEDLIWGGSPALPRMNRAAVKLVFDNTPQKGGKRLFNVDFDEVAIERTVHRDGMSEYAINGSQVRLRDIIELLAHANIGASGHHIISQGEADRILSASSRERREMIEDALGLKIYQYKLEESAKKLEKTEENIKQVELLEKEVAPHLRFLKGQVERIEKAGKMREELGVLYREYLKREDTYLKIAEDKMHAELSSPEEELRKLESELARAREVLELTSKKDAKGKEVLAVERELSDVRRQKDEKTREMGRLEGQVAFVEDRLTRLRAREASTQAVSIPLSEIQKLKHAVDAEAAREGATLDELRGMLSKIRTWIGEFIDRHLTRSDEQGEEERHLASLVERRREVGAEMEQLAARELEQARRYAKLQEEISEAKDEGREAERRVFEISAKQGELRARVEMLKGKQEQLLREKEAFEREVREAVVLVGRDIMNFYDLALSGAEREPRERQYERGKALERLKIRLEEFGGGGEEVLKEYEEVKSRSEFLAREIEDLERSATSLRKLMDDLSLELRKEFNEGVGKINREFQNFFALMFGGGTASLVVVEEQKRSRKAELALLEGEDLLDDHDEVEAGIEINVSLPRKKVKGLMMLSGGERALTSIALIFSMTQVNPPPFLILDETDAALDEANSKRYADMIEELGKKSQLIVITHNRATMSAAGELYGVTMGQDGVSKVLSVKLEEAERVAK